MAEALEKLRELTAAAGHVFLPDDVPFTTLGLHSMQGHRQWTDAYLLHCARHHGLALASLTYLIIIHKLEYFLNARIVGGQIHARAWELLLAMLTMEAAFGFTGLMAAPIYYAYIKDELRDSHLI